LGTSPKNSQYEFSSSVTEEYQDGENSYCEFFGLVPFLHLAIQLHKKITSCWTAYQMGETRNACRSFAMLRRAERPLKMLRQRQAAVIGIAIK
jgi:hypothetical protein